MIPTSLVHNPPPVPKPRTRFNCGRLSTDEGKSENGGGETRLEIDTNATQQEYNRMSIYPTLSPSPNIPPPKPPRESSNVPPIRPPPPAGWNVTAASTSTSLPLRLAPSIPGKSDFFADKPVPPIPSRPPLHLNNIIPLELREDENKSKVIEISPIYIENPAYMSLQKYREMTVSSSNESGFYSQQPINDDSKSSSDSEDEEATRPYQINLQLEISPQNLDFKPPSTSTMKKSFNDYTPPPKRDNYAFASDIIESIIDADDRKKININGETNNESPEIEGVAVSFFGYVALHIGKKDKKRAYARLKNMHLSFHDDEESGEYLCGPFQLTGCQLINRTENIVSIRLNELESQKHLTFTVEDDLDTWSLLLSECWLTQYDLLRNSVTGMTTCGIFYLRQGTASEWQSAAGGLLNRTLHYIILNALDCIYELDIRKVISIKEKVEKDQWCPLIKKKSHRGPFILILEGCSLYIECDDDWSTNLWYDVLQETLTRPATYLDEYRLTGDNIPIIVDKCIRFISAYGMQSEGIYRRNGKISEAKEIIGKLSKDAPSVHLKPVTDETVYAVADVLRQYFRRLATPLIGKYIQPALFSIICSSDDMAIKCNAMSQCFQSLSVVHYNTLRKLISHLSDVASHSTENRASIENLAKIFGASLFHTESEEGPCFSENSNQISVIAMLITHYDRIFEQTSREELSKVLIEEATKIKTPSHKAVRADGLLIPIHIWEKDNWAFNVKTELAAEEVCREAVAKRGFDAEVDGKYAIFEICRGGALIRRLIDSEKLSEIVINRWIPWKCHDGYLLFDRDLTTALTPENMSTYSGKIKLAEPGSKSFKSMELKIEEGEKIIAFKGEKKQKEWQIENTVWFSGAEGCRKAPYTFNLTFFVDATNFLQKHIGFCVSFKTTTERTAFLNQINYIQQSTRPAPLVHI